MSKLDDRLAELGLTVPTTSKPVAAYIPAVASGNLVYTSGQRHENCSYGFRIAAAAGACDACDGQRIVRACFASRP